jgi:hypothetical protein
MNTTLIDIQLECEYIAESLEPYALRGADPYPIMLSMLDDSDFLDVDIAYSDAATALCAVSPREVKEYMIGQILNRLPMIQEYERDDD